MEIQKNEFEIIPVIWGKDNDFRIFKLNKTTGQTWLFVEQRGDSRWIEIPLEPKKKQEADIQ